MTKDTKFKQNDLNLYPRDKSNQAGTNYQLVNVKPRFLLRILACGFVWVRVLVRFVMEGLWVGLNFVDWTQNLDIINYVPLIYDWECDWIVLLLPRNIDDNENREVITLVLFLSPIFDLGLGRGFLKLVGINFIHVLSVKMCTW